MAASLPSRAARGRRTPIADINVTPLVDVMLVLLIIFMVTAPLMTAGVPVNLPDSRAKALDQAKEPVQLSIEANGLIHLGDEELSEAQLPARLEQLAAGHTGQPPQVYLRADRSLDYGRVAKVLGELAHAGLTKVALVSVEGAAQGTAAPPPLMVERAEKAGFGVALVGHAALFALLSLRLLTPPLPVPPPEQAIEVSLAPDIALRQAAPPAPTPPAASEAPEQGPPEEEAVPEPAPAPRPAPAKPQPAPVKAADPAQLEADRAAKAAARAAWVEKVQAANAAKAETARVAAQQAEATRAAAAAAKAEARAAWVEKVKAANAAKAEAARVAAEKAEAARVAANAARADAVKAAAAEKRAKGSRLGKDFLKGLADAPAKAPSAAAPGATMSPRALADIASAIQRQIQPCANRQVNPAQGQAERIRVTLNLKLNRDGSLAAPPRVINHDGLDVDNRRYIDRVDDLAIAAFVGCAPLRGLPGELYDVPNGWRSINLRFKLPD